MFLGNTADARRSEVRLLRLDTPRATQLLITLLLPLGDQHGVGIAVFEQIVVKLLADGFFRVVEVVDVSRTLVGDLEDGPCHLVLLLALVRCVFSVFHLVLKFE